MRIHGQITAQVTAGRFAGSLKVVVALAMPHTDRELSQAVT
jgi:hypothetical protein